MTSAGTPLNAGPVVSVTRTVNDAAAASFPDASCPLHFTVVSAQGNDDPAAGTQLTTGLGSTSSLAVTVYATGVSAPVASTVTGTAGTVITGGVVSGWVVTVTWKLAAP